MAIYAIGDIHGCWQTFANLLGELRFAAGADRLICVGDLVNRGPKSLEVLRWFREHEPRATAVLGNHDLHLLACAAGVRKQKSKDTIGDVLIAPDRRELLDWLRRRPLLVEEAGWTIVHAGLHPDWDLAEAAHWAREVEERLRAPGWEQLLAGMYEQSTLDWRRARTREEGLQCALRIFCSLRACTRDGRLHSEFAGPTEETPISYFPWYKVPGRRHAGARVVCGHWAAAGLLVGPELIALDSGCAWGKELSAIELATLRVSQVPHADGLEELG